ncbi:MAG: hypothetical protein WCK02_01615 [Bacteroidota bacterium]
MKPTKKICRYCEKEFVSTRKNEIYCSKTCKQYSYLERKSTDNSNSVNTSVNTLVNNLVNESANKTANPIKTETYTFQIPQLFKNLDEMILSRVKEGKDFNYFFKHPFRLNWTYTEQYHIRIINQTLKPILTKLLSLSYTFLPSYQLFENISKKLNAIIESENYQNLPQNYPYIKFVKETAEKLTQLCDINQSQTKIKFKMSNEMKLKIHCILYELS